MKTAEILFKTDDELLFWKEWNEFIENHPASYRYLQTYLEYTTKYTQGIVADRSFIYFRGGRVVGICPLLIEQVNGRKQISSAGGFAAAPLAHDEKAEKILFQKIEEIGKEYGVAVIKFFLDPLLNKNYGYFNQLRKYGFLDASSADAIVDLTVDESFLWQGLRKSYKPLINGVLKNSDYSIEFFDRNNASYDAHEMYRVLHHKCAGKVTRPKETFDLQYKILQEGHSLLAGLCFKGTWVAFNYFVFFQKKAIYFSTSDDPDYSSSNSSLYHALLWSSMVKLKTMGIDALEMSQPVAYHEVEGFLDYADKKQIDIGMYKRGMPSVMTPQFRGVKYFDLETLRNDLDGFSERMVECARASQKLNLELK